MPLFDTHAHFSRLGGEYALDAQLDRAKEAGVARIVAIGGSCKLNKAAVDAARDYPEMIRIALGFDRDNAEKLSDPAEQQDAMDRIRLGVDKLPAVGVQVCAVGEIGLDYHYHPETAAQQVALFRTQLELANELGLPVVVHSRDADEDTLAALADHARDWKGDANRIGVLHCFTRDDAMAAQLVELGYHVSFSGIVTFLNADPLREVAKAVPDEKLLNETDAPYLAPAPMRGNRNEPAFVRHIATRLAEVRGVDQDELEELTFANASRLFDWV